MTQVGIVLVHGGQHDAWCWERLRPLLDSPSIAVSLPGRGPPSHGLADQPTLDDHAREVVRGIVGTDFEQVVLVGHSMAGVIVPEVASRLPHQVRDILLIAADVPPEGGTLIDVLPRWQRPFAAAIIRRRQSVALPRPIAEYVFCNDLDPEWTAFVLERLAPEPLGRLAFEPVSRRDLPPATRRTYLKLLDDRAIPPRCQDRAIAALGADSVSLQAGHDAMLSRPDRIAAVINRITADKRKRT